MGTSERLENAGAALVELACALRLVETRRDRTELVEALCSPAVPTVVAFVNAHAANLAVEDPQLHDDLMNADVLLRDGTGMAVLCKALHRDPGVNMNGTDLIPELLAANVGRSVALIGTQEPWLSAAADQIRGTSSVEVVLDGFSDEAVYVDALRETPVDLILLGMGMPKQERVGTLLVRRSRSHARSCAEERSSTSSGGRYSAHRRGFAAPDSNGSGALHWNPGDSSGGT